MNNNWFRALVVLLSVSAFVGCSVKAKRSRYMNRAEAYFKKGEYIKAEIEYRNAARLSKTLEPDLIARIATIYYEEGRFAESFAPLTNAVALKPDDVDLRYRLGKVELMFGEFQAAREAALAILEKRPNVPEGLLLLAESSYGPEEIKAAREKVDEILRITGETWSAHVTLAELAMREKETNIAETELRMALKLDPKAPPVNDVLAQLASLRDQPQEVEKFLRTAAENSPPRSLRRLALAQFKMHGTNLAEAKSLVDQQLKEAPDYVPAWVLRGQIALAEKDFAECSRIVKSVSSWNPLSYDIRLLDARAMVMQKQPAKALEEFARLEVLAPHDPNVKYEAAVAHLQNGAPAEAIKKLDELIRLFPNYPQAIVLRSELKLRAGAADEAVAALVPFTTTHPELTTAQLLLANGYRALGRPDNALVIYRRLIERSPGVAQFQFLAGTASLQQNKSGEALAFFQQALRIDPAFTPAAEQLVTFDLEKHDLASAGLRAEQQLKATTNSPAALMLKARVSLAGKDYAGAESALTRIISLQPESAAPYSLLASIYLSQGDPQKALAQLRTAIDKNPGNPAPLVLVGELYERLKDFDNAKKAYEDALKLNPSLPSALNDLAYLLSERFNEVDRALPYATKARELAPNDWGTQDTLGWILYRRGEFGRALLLLRESAANLPAEAEVQYHLAMAFYSMDDEASARSAFAKVIQLNKSLADAKNVQKRLAVLDIDASAPDAIPALETALQEDANDFVAALKLGQACQRAGAVEKTRNALERAVKINSGIPKALLLLASLQADQLQDLPKALETARQARKVAPNDPSVAGIVGRISYRAGDYSAALALLQEFANSPQAGPESTYDLALAYYGVGQVDQARANLRRYSAAAGGNRLTDARNLLALLDFQDGKGDAGQAAALAASRLQQDTNDLAGLMTLGLVARQSGKFSEAAAKFERIAVLDKLFPSAQRQLAIIYSENLGDDAKALEYGGNARRVYSDDPELSRALGKAAYRQNDFRSAAQRLKEAAGQSTVDAETLFYLGMSQFKLRQLPDAKSNLQKAIAAGLDAKFSVEANAALKDIKP